jgi:hypothetical protein
VGAPDPLGRAARAERLRARRWRLLHDPRALNPDGIRDFSRSRRRNRRSQPKDREGAPVGNSNVVSIPREHEASARDERERRTLREPRRYSELVEHLHATRGFAVAAWCGTAECERRIKHDSSATIRCLPLDQPAQLPPCICCGSAALAEAVWAQAY